MEKNAEEYFETMTCVKSREKEERGISGEMSNQLLLECSGYAALSGDSDEKLVAEKL